MSHFNLTSHLNMDKKFKLEPADNLCMQQLLLV